MHAVRCSQTQRVGSTSGKTDSSNKDSETTARWRAAAGLKRELGLSHKALVQVSSRSWL